MVDSFAGAAWLCGAVDGGVGVDFAKAHAVKDLGAGFGCLGESCCKNTTRHYRFLFSMLQFGTIIGSPRPRRIGIGRRLRVLVELKAAQTASAEQNAATAAAASPIALAA